MEPLGQRKPVSGDGTARMNANDQAAARGLRETQGWHVRLY